MKTSRSSILLSQSITALALMTLAGPVSAKGLNSLAKDNPGTPADAAAEAPDSTEAAAPATGTTATTPSAAPAQAATPAAEGAAQAAPMVQSATSKALDDRLSLSTSFGWIRASQSEGDWRSSGVSDVTLAWRLGLKTIDKLDLWTSLRYAPIAIAGEIDGVSYRGVWEAWNIGAIGKYLVGNGLRAVGSFEVGYVLVYLRPLNDIETSKNHEKNGVMASLGAGVDWDVVPKFAFGPRLNVGFGSTTAIQVAASGTFTF